jgi:hypothetical protein
MFDEKYINHLSKDHIEAVSIFEVIRLIHSKKPNSHLGLMNEIKRVQQQ